MQDRSIVFYDPNAETPFAVTDRQGQTLFTNDHTDLCLIECRGVEWDDHRELFLECLLMSGSRGFVAVSPWSPGSSRLTTQVGELVGSIVDYGEFVAGNFASSREVFSALLDLRNGAGAWSSGEWCFGTSAQPFAFDRTAQVQAPLGGFPEGFLLASADSIGCGLSLGELQQSLFAIKVTDRVRSMVPLLRTALS